MSLEKAKYILDHSQLTQEEKDMWALALVQYGDDVADKFVSDIGEDETLLRIATQFLRARLHSGEELIAGTVTKAEGNLLLDIIAQEKVAEGQEEVQQQSVTQE